MIDDAAAIELVKGWYEGEPGRYKTGVGIPNAGLQVLELFRTYWPLRDRHYLTPGGGQVTGLSGASGDKIVARYDQSLGSMGVEAGRTSRSTPEAARRLVIILNQLPEDQASAHEVRSRLADVMQRWVVESILAPHLSANLINFDLDPEIPISDSIDAYLERMHAYFEWQALVTAVLASALQVAGYSDIRTAGSSSGAVSAEDLRVGDTGIVVTKLPTLAHIERCRKVVEDRGLRCLLVTAPSRDIGSRQLLEAAGLQRVPVVGASRFLALLIESTAGFDFLRCSEVTAQIASHVEVT